MTLPKLYIQGQALIFEGTWGSVFLGQGETLLKEIIGQSFQTIDIRTSKVDSNGAFLIAQSFQGKNIPITAPESVLNLIKSAQTFSLALPIKEAKPSWIVRVLATIGRTCVQVWDIGIKLLAFFGQILNILWRTLGQPRFKALVVHLEAFGLNAMPIVGLISLLIGMVLAYQGINQLSRFGAEIFTVDFLGIGVLREIGVLLTSIVIAGRSASAIAAQIGTMRLNQEVDAIRMMGLHPIHVLVIPRILAMIISLPCLVFFSDVMALIGGMFTMALVIEMHPQEYLILLQKAITPAQFWVGMSKAPLFAIVISMVGCFRGFQVQGSAESVGQMTTRAVVESIFLVIIFDALISIMYSYMKI